ncbi:helix-turn-helix domain-containing protein [Paenibacillus mucilaginosus]|uniref:helix-turn-helix domain-containing protein n=1 Tax=Paenibacillus mucilaginosus TaxID=61624 RepID=UPI0005A02E16|nr:helix-turn-helix domain-containing protein [Paenibacillus mucilaginosus]MCG7216027.1 helix-turn-helix domain-containing protein [Paenibacillus mucilaginosus]WDM31071.1 helix-turn-helix domain-containing protein [Paenibacillus mucilaginosus]
MRVVLVDDEKGIVDGLQKLMGRYIPECEIAGVAYNGVEGAQLIQACKPDIVITDIRMPHADGLDMIAMLQEAGCKAKYILLSGYADFEYARKGMRLGVQYYINKPVEEEELRDCVCDAMEQIRVERGGMQQIDNLKSVLLQHTLRDLIDAGRDNPFYARELLRSAEIPMTHTSFVCALLELDSPLNPGADMGFESVFSLVERVCSPFGGVYPFRYTANQAAILVTDEGSIEYGELIDALHGLKEAVWLELQLSMAAGVGTVKEQAVDIRLSFEEARDALTFKMGKGAGAVIPYSEQVRNEHHASRKKDTIAEIKAYVEEHFHEPISLADLSARFFINPYYLSQLFKQKTGETYLNYLVQIRMNKAKELLAMTDQKVYEICQAVGYSDSQYFSRLFEKLTGCKPSEYRRRSNDRMAER